MVACSDLDVALDRDVGVAEVEVGERGDDSNTLATAVTMSMRPRTNIDRGFMMRSFAGIGSFVKALTPLVR